MGGGPRSPQIGFTIRVATLDDLDRISQVHVDGFTEEPQVHYCYPYRFDYPDDHWFWTRKEYEEYLAQPEKYMIHVIEPVSESEDRYTTVEPVGVAVWNLAVKIKAIGRAPATDERKDADPKRCNAFFSKAARRFDTHFAEWAEKQVNLGTLVIHPDFRLRGAGTMMVNWGIERAKEKNWPVTLCASPMGRLLYLHLGFKQVATEVVQLEGEDETLESAVMVLDSARDPSSSS